MKIRFWGTRGSIAKPGQATVRYGGNTSCVEVVSAGGTRLVIDCGTGAHELGQALLAAGPSRGAVLISHTHWDHIQGIPFFTPFFVPGFEWDIYAPQGFGESLKDTLAGQMEYTYFPVTPEAFGAQVRYHDLGEGSFAIGDLTIRTRYLNHPALTLAFRIEGDGSSLVYACDHEPHSRELALGGDAEVSGEDLSHADFIAGADLLIHDAQYVAAEYAAKQGWGHSTVEYALTIAKAARVKRLAFTHHDPSRSDDQIDAIVARMQAATGAEAPIVIAAAEGMEIELGSASAKRSAAPAVPSLSAIRSGGSGESARVLLATEDDLLTAKLARAVADEPVVLERLGLTKEVVARIAAQNPALLLADARLAEIECVAAALGPQTDSCPPAVLLGGSGPLPEGWSDRLEEPWSVEYARTRIRTWLLRSECHWALPPVPRNEDARLAALTSLSMLDTPREERFDRHTRIAAALFRVPIALVSLVDRDRQWFKSCFGTELCEGPRDSSFCAHAIAADRFLIVPDTLQDERFRDNPQVADGPRIRFYAGAILRSAEGLPLGTLCILDLRPRDLSEEERALLQDIAAAVEAELLEPGIAVAAE